MTFLFIQVDHQYQNAKHVYDLKTEIQILKITNLKKLRLKDPIIKQ
jgi:hypothetical protein